MEYIPLVWRMRASKAKALDLLGKKGLSKEEYREATEVIRKLMDNIGEPESKRIYLSDPLVAEIIAGSGQ